MFQLKIHFHTNILIIIYLKETSSNTIFMPSIKSESLYIIYRNISQTNVTSIVNGVMLGKQMEG